MKIMKVGVSFAVLKEASLTKLVPIEFNCQNLYFLKDFKNHVKEEHNMWNYMRFIIYVKERPEHKHNALEKYVFEQVYSKI